MEEALAHFIFLLHERNGFSLVDGSLTLPAAFRVCRQRLLQFVGEAKIVHNQTAGFCP